MAMAIDDVLKVLPARPNTQYKHLASPLRTAAQSRFQLLTMLLPLLRSNHCFSLFLRFFFRTPQSSGHHDPRKKKTTGAPCSKVRPGGLQVFGVYPIPWSQWMMMVGLQADISHNVLVDRQIEVMEPREHLLP